MGLKEMLFGGSEARLKKHAARARNKDAQSADRWASLEALREDGSPAALEGLLGRFTIRYDKTIEDEQEKEFVFESLRSLGEELHGPLLNHLRSADSLAWGLKLLHSVTGPGSEARWTILGELCERNDNSYARDPSKKIDLLHALGDEVDDPRAVDALVPYLEDMNGDVRFTAVESLLKLKAAEAAKDALVRLLLSEGEEVRRIKTRIVDGLAELGWSLGESASAVERLLLDLLPGARIDAQGRVQRKG
jgi:HEAT repeat protein